MATEEASYTVAAEDGDFEIRDYAPQVLAEIVVDGSLEDAGNTAFRRLFRYISGANAATNRLAATPSPSQTTPSVKIAMTAPVTQQATGTQWAVGFTMPGTFTLETLPTPNDPSITLREVPARRMAAVRYTGTWSEAGYARHRSALEAWLLKQHLLATGDPVWARYDPPFMPWFWRRNEVLIPIPGENVP
ncbi:MAG: heme-binding protein [Lentisphaerae bacterium]|nr:heme-binding protein [Lentisphaerota bacterium]